MMDWGDGLQLPVPASEFEAMGKDVRLILQYTLDYSDYNMIQFFYGDWQANPSFIINGTEYEMEYIPSNVHGVGNGESCSSTITFSESVYNTLAQKGMAIQGHGVRLNKVLLSNATSGVQTVILSSQSTSQYYSIDGRHVVQPKKGIYIQGGKKYIKQ